MIYTKIPKSLITDTDYHSALLVYSALANRCYGQKNHCHISNETLAAESGIKGKATLVKAKQALVDLGYISSQQRYCTSNNYWVYTPRKNYVILPSAALGLSGAAYHLLAYLRYLYIDTDTTIKAVKIRNDIGIKDNKTLAKAFRELAANGYLSIQGEMNLTKIKIKQVDLTSEKLNSTSEKLNSTSEKLNIKTREKLNPASEKLNGGSEFLNGPSEKLNPNHTILIILYKSYYVGKSVISSNSTSEKKKKKSPVCFHSRPLDSSSSVTPAHVAPPAALVNSPDTLYRHYKQHLKYSPHLDEYLAGPDYTQVKPCQDKAKVSEWYLKQSPVKKEVIEKCAAWHGQKSNLDKYTILADIMADGLLWWSYLAQYIKQQYGLSKKKFNKKQIRAEQQYTQAQKANLFKQYDNLNDIEKEQVHQYVDYELSVSKHIKNPDKFKGYLILEAMAQNPIYLKWLREKPTAQSTTVKKKSAWAMFN